MTIGTDERLLELAERCEQEEGYNLDLDHEIGRSLSTDGNYSYRAYTASLDDAMTLVPEPEKGVSVWRSPRDGGLCCATVHHGLVTEARTLALALCAAALRARTASSTSHE